MHIFWLYQSQRGIYGRNVLIFISITFSEKHLTAVWTVLWFCAVGTGWIGSTTANTKLKNPTKRTDRRRKKTKNRQMDRRAARMTTNYSKDEKRKLSLSLSKTGLHRLCSGSCTNTLTHSHKHPHGANTSAKKPAPIFFFTFFLNFFRPHCPHPSSRYFDRQKEIG